MIERRRRLRFADETFARFVILDQMRGQEFQRDGPVELRILGLVYHAHAAPAELGGDLVVGDGLADHNGPILPLLGIAG